MFTDRIKKEQKIELTITRTEIEVAICEYVSRNSEEIGIQDDHSIKFEVDHEGHLTGAEIEIISKESI